MLIIEKKWKHYDKRGNCSWWASESVYTKKTVSHSYLPRCNLYFLHRRNVSRFWGQQLYIGSTLSHLSFWLYFWRICTAWTLCIYFRIKWVYNVRKCKEILQITRHNSNVMRSSLKNVTMTNNGRGQNSFFLKDPYPSSFFGRLVISAPYFPLHKSLIKARLLGSSNSSWILFSVI